MTPAMILQVMIAAPEGGEPSFSIAKMMAIVLADHHLRHKGLTR